MKTLRDLDRYRRWLATRPTAWLEAYRDRLAADCSHNYADTAERLFWVKVVLRSRDVK